MTLRLRLLLLLVGIVAAGLVISDVVTYDALRSFLTTRVDQQLEVAAFPVGRALLSSSGLGPRVQDAPPALTVPGGSRQFTSPGAFRNGGGLLAPGRGSDRGVLVPPGTYGQLRNTKGRTEAHLFFDYGGKAPTAPVVPAKLPGSGLPSATDLYFTAPGTGPGAVTYRVLAKPLADGSGVIVVAVPLSDLDSTLRHLLWVELIVSALVLVGLGVLSWVMVRRDLRPLEAMTKTAGAIAHGDLSQRVTPAAGGTEVGQLGQAFNTMINEIEVAFAERAASEDRLRRFLADASHELRTPLTSILGYSELFGLGVRDRPDDLTVSLRHIRDEATRMSTLVDDLFLLAQLDHERPLRFEPVDLVALARQAAEALSVSAPGHPSPSWATGCGRGRGGPRPAPPGHRQPGRQRRQPHTGGDRHRDQGHPERRRTAIRARSVGRRDRSRRRTGHRRARRPPHLRGVLPIGPVALPVVGWRRPGPGHRGRPSSGPTGARSSSSRARGPPSRCACPPRDRDRRGPTWTKTGATSTRNVQARAPSSPSGR